MRNKPPLLECLLAQPTAQRLAALAVLTGAERAELRHHWELWARPEQLPPRGDWRIWLVMAGRGFGKTRLGAEWVRRVAADHPDARIALVGASLGDARAVMVEGESGILACSPPRRRPRFEPSLRRLVWPNGAQATIYSAGEPESLRGPQHSHAWCDEIAKWDNAAQRAEQSWNNLLLGMRLGENPQALATTTPRAVPLLMQLLDQEDAIITRGRTQDNLSNLPARFIKDMRRSFGRSALARQELDGELLSDIEGALWTRAMIETARESTAGAQPVRTVIGVDPPASAAGDACGIIVAQLGDDGVARILADATVQRASPEKWARAVAEAAATWRADRVVAEANQGGAMVESVLRAACIALPIRLVHASVGKAARAEPVAALYETGRVRHVGAFPALEDQLCGLVAGGAYQGPGRSPDRADAAVWALTELMLSTRAPPRVLDL
ncbi:phage terminase large subunit-like protein [Novosphingobium sp. 1748]|uniref:DNA-packaging protein n=1 Tax=Novosphingobium sp. 1748 TaxID=2817760 RepID=UPI0028548B12|nr:terminase family protein [Novosphingobium sp. 1748]MDR6709993.1 phage terminase large subunit-like protein [Novosphingobium sp. 1748]